MVMTVVKEEATEIFGLRAALLSSLSHLHKTQNRHPEKAILPAVFKRFLRVPSLRKRHWTPCVGINPSINIFFS